MIIKYEYPLATEENMKALQDAIDCGKDIYTIFEMFDEELLWDCYVVTSGQQDTPWQVFDWQEEDEQYRIEDWQQDRLENFLLESTNHIGKYNLQQ